VIQGKKFIDRTKFQKSAHGLVREIEQLQILAMSYGCDVTLTMIKRDGAWAIQVSAAEARIPKRDVAIAGAEKITWNRREALQEQLTISSSGRIFPEGVLGLIPGGSEPALYLNLTTPLFIALSAAAPSRSAEIALPERPKFDK
jgi:hypothetical protein